MKQQHVIEVRVYRLSIICYIKIEKKVLQRSEHVLAIAAVRSLQRFTGLLSLIHYYHMFPLPKQLSNPINCYGGQVVHNLEGKFNRLHHGLSTIAFSSLPKKIIAFS